MIRRKPIEYGVAVLIAAVSITGCSDGNSSSVRQARVAEERGEAHVAYDHYCAAAKQRPEDAGLAASIKRLAPTAATYWESQARIAESQGDHAEAWRRGMKSLLIRPDQPGMAEYVNRLESEHPDAIASSRQQWMNSGRIQVAAAPNDLSEVESPAAQEPVVTASAAPLPSAASNTRNRDADDREAARRREMERRQRERDDAAKQRAAREAELKRTREREAQERKERDRAAQERRERDRQIAEARRQERARKDAKAAPKTLVEDVEPQPSEGEGVSEFAVLYTLSRDEDQHPKRVRLADGIYMKLRDVDDDRTVGMDLDDGKDRVQKIRDLKVGQSKLFRGRSGKWFRFTLIEVRPEVETIRVGVKPA